MPLQLLEHATEFVHQVSGQEDTPPVVYLPGVHGDWTPLNRARPLLAERLLLIEAAYPRVEHWTLEDFSQSLANLLDVLELQSVHVIGESFGSLVGWEFGLSFAERVRSLILVGGFSQPPRYRAAGTVSSALRVLPTLLLEKGIDWYVALKTRRGQARTSPGSVPPYPATRTERGKFATARRMAIIQRSDFRQRLRDVRFPVRYIGGGADWVIPVRREIETLERTLPRGCEFKGKVIEGAPHMIIASHPEQTVDQIVSWVQEVDDNYLKQTAEESAPGPSFGHGA